MITLNRFLKLCVCGAVLVLTAAAQQGADSSPRVQPASLDQDRAAVLSVQDVIDLVEAGLSDDLVMIAGWTIVIRTETQMVAPEAWASSSQPP